MSNSLPYVPVPGLPVWKTPAEFADWMKLAFASVKVGVNLTNIDPLLEELDKRSEDILGNIYTLLNFNKSIYPRTELARSAAKATLEELFKSKPKDGKDFYTIVNPHTISGEYAIALNYVAQNLYKNNKTRIFYVLNTDNDTCALMTYVQCNLLGIPAFISQSDWLDGKPITKWLTTNHLPIREIEYLRTSFKPKPQADLT